MGADVKSRHKRFGLVFDAIIFWWHFFTLINADLLSVPERIPIGECISDQINELLFF
jgi:hypothetical protein